MKHAVAAGVPPLALFVWSALALALAATSPAARAADNLPDPMRPSGGGPAGAAAADRAAPARGGGGGGSGGSGGWKLQSVLLGASGAQAAVISGTLVALGDRLGEARLLSLTERSAVLAGPHGQTTLLLIPGVDKQEARAGAPRPLAARSAVRPATSLASESAP